MNTLIKNIWIGLLILCTTAANSPTLISNKDILFLASVINAECGTCGGYEMRLVGLVVLNRVHSDKFPNSIEEVIYQDSQFFGVGTDEYKPTEISIKIAGSLLSRYPKASKKEKSILYFYHPKKSTNREFIRQVKIVFREKNHYYGK